jgi:2-alkyl-3-oxoalkanoate reductase
LAKAVVTGAAGFLGRAFTGALVERGWEVRGVDVRPGPRVTVADVTRAGAWTAVLDGADLVVHAAAMVSEAGDERTFWRVNVDGTRTVLEESAAAQVGRVLHLSSIAVHGSSFPDGVDEGGPVRMTGNPYTDTVVSAEHQALLHAASGTVPVTVVRPGDVYGPHSVAWTLRPVELMRRNLFFLFDGGRGVLSPIYVDDLVEGALAAATADAGVGQVFHLTGGAGVSARDFFGWYAAMLGVGLRALPVPTSLLAGPINVVSRTLGHQSPLSPRTREYVTHPGTYSIAKAERLLAWTPRVPLEEGMARTRLWLEETGLIPAPEGDEEIDDAAGDDAAGRDGDAATPR